MKSLLITAVLLASGAAIAQESPPVTPATPATPAAPATPATPPTADASAMPAAPAMPAMPAAPASPSNPETDARGIPVVSAPAVAPAGANAPVEVPAGATVSVAPNQASVFTPKASEGDLPACSKTVTDRCKQTYERKR